MELIDIIKAYAQEISADFREKKGKGQLTLTVAERKAFLSSQKLTYQARFRVDEKKKTLHFFEMLKESSSGMSSGGMEFSTTKFKTGRGGRQESVIEQQSRLFGKKYDYEFDFQAIRGRIESMAEKSGYSFEYHITPKWL